MAKTVGGLKAERKLSLNGCGEVWRCAGSNPVAAPLKAVWLI